MFLPSILFLLFSLQVLCNKVRVVNLGALPTEHISIHISENVHTIPSFDSNQNPTVMDEATKKEIQDLTAIFTMFSLLDELSNQIFVGGNGNKGFLSLDEMINEKPEKKNKRVRKNIFDQIIEDSLKEEESEEDEKGFNKRNDDFKEAHVEFTEGKTTINEKNQKKLIENIKNKEEIEVISDYYLEK